MPVERNRWILALGGRGDDKPPADWDGCLAFARELRTPTVYNAIDIKARSMAGRVD
jgi:hypothetical protein